MGPQADSDAPTTPGQRRWRLWAAALCLLPALPGCVMPPDLLSGPAHGPPAAVARDGTLSGEAPIPSALLKGALARPDAHELVLLESGDDALLARIHLIRAARQTIDVQTFIWIHDRSGGWVFNELLAAARRGVRVRVLVDAFVLPGIPAEEYAALAALHQNLEIRLFRPLWGNAINPYWTLVPSTLTRFTSMNRRMHNKVFVVDGAVAITGGRNYQDSYYDRDPVFTFRDREVLVSGPVCADMAASFEDFWDDRDSYEATTMRDLRRALESGRARLPDPVDHPRLATFTEVHALANTRDLAAARPDLAPQQVQSMRFLADSPQDARRKPSSRAPRPFDPLEAAIAAARSEVLIQTPYPVISKTLVRLSREIRNAAPDARIRLSSNSLASTDHLVVAGIALKQRRVKIKDLRLEVHLARPVPADIRDMVPRHDILMQEAGAGPGPRYCLHAKSIVIDRRVSFVGTHNFDPRSFKLNSECGLLIEDEPFARRLAALIERDIHPRNSWVLAPRQLPPVISHLNNFITCITSRLPVFDIWPIEPISSFELRDGGELRSPFDADFNDHYQDAGSLAGTKPGMRELQTHLIRAFGSFTAPLM